MLGCVIYPQGYGCGPAQAVLTAAAVCSDVESRVVLATQLHLLPLGSKCFLAEYGQ
jgi:hypothetical protein